MVVIGPIYSGLSLVAENDRTKFSVVGIERNPERVPKADNYENCILDSTITLTTAGNRCLHGGVGRVQGQSTHDIGEFVNW